MEEVRYRGAEVEVRRQGPLHVVFISFGFRSNQDIPSLLWGGMEGGGGNAWLPEH